jgi:Carboxypeptidase regulatory-like domain
MAIALTLSLRVPAQTVQTPEVQLGRVMSTVIDVNGDPVTGATVALTSPNLMDRRTAVTAESGFFEFDDLKPGVPYVLIVSADGFENWTSPAITLEPGQFNLLGGIQLRIATAHTTVEVT